MTFEDVLALADNNQRIEYLSPLAQVSQPVSTRSLYVFSIKAHNCRAEE